MKNIIACNFFFYGNLKVAIVGKITFLKFNVRNKTCLIFNLNVLSQIAAFLWQVAYILGHFAYILEQAAYILKQVVDIIVTNCRYFMTRYRYFAVSYRYFYIYLFIVPDSVCGANLLLLLLWCVVLRWWLVKLRP